MEDSGRTYATERLFSTEVCGWSVSDQSFPQSFAVKQKQDSHKRIVTDVV